MPLASEIQETLCQGVCVGDSAIFPGLKMFSGMSASGQNSLRKGWANFGLSLCPVFTQCLFSEVS